MIIRNKMENKKIHQGFSQEELYQHHCPECNKSFCQAANLRRHMRIHSGERPYKCTQCDKKFSDRSSLTWHRITHGEKRNFKCNKCGKEFFLESHLIRHGIIHTNHRPFACPICGKTLRRLDSLKYHINTHNTEKPFTCVCCNKKFASLSAQRKHERHVRKKVQTKSRSHSTSNKIKENFPHNPSGSSSSTSGENSSDSNDIIGIQSIHTESEVSWSHVQECLNKEQPIKVSLFNTVSCLDNETQQNTTSLSKVDSIRDINNWTESNLELKDRQDNVYNISRRIYEKIEIDQVSTIKRPDVVNNVINVIDSKNTVEENIDTDLLIDEDGWIENEKTSNTDLLAEYEDISQQFNQLYSNVPKLILVKRLPEPYTSLFQSPAATTFCCVCKTNLLELKVLGDESVKKHVCI